jgi:hypothetical protein
MIELTPFRGELGVLRSVLVTYTRPAFIIDSVSGPFNGKFPVLRAGHRRGQTNKLLESTAFCLGPLCPMDSVARKQYVAECRP